MKIAIEYQNVGRGKFSGIINHDLQQDTLSANDVAALAYQEARKHLISNDVEAVYDSSSNHGTIYAGFHTAGNFKLVEGKVNLEIVARLRKEK